METPTVHAGVLRTPLLERIQTTIRAEVDPQFGFLAPGPAPWTTLSRPLAECCVALVTTAGLHLRGDSPFRALEERLGDPGFRTIPHGTAQDELDLGAGYVDQKYTPRDSEVALPMQALSALQAAGVIGRPAARHHSFVGGLIRPYPGLNDSVAALDELLHADAVDVVVCIPTCSICVQTAALVARELEVRGFATTCLSLVPELSEIVCTPRTLSLKFPFGAPCGDPGNALLHQSVLQEALALLTTADVAGTLRESTLRWRRSPAESGSRAGGKPELP